jgi:hypothetical protein
MALFSRCHELEEGFFDDKTKYFRSTDAEYILIS